LSAALAFFNKQKEFRVVVILGKYSVKVMGSLKDNLIYEGQKVLNFSRNRVIFKPLTKLIAQVKPVQSLVKLLNLKK